KRNDEGDNQGDHFLPQGYSSLKIWETGDVGRRFEQRPLRSVSQRCRSAAKIQNSTGLIWNGSNRSPRAASIRSKKPMSVTHLSVAADITSTTSTSTTRFCSLFRRRESALASYDWA